MTNFATLHPTPDHKTATAWQVAGWYAAEAL
jgi:hypothetical protein